jgi:hypothetical protein
MTWLILGILVYAFLALVLLSLCKAGSVGEWWR